MGPRSRLAGVVAVLALLAASGTAEVEDAVATGFTLENAIEVPTSPDVTWTALVGDVGRWWPRDHTWWGEASELTIDPRAGGCFCERAGGNEARHLEVVFVEKPKLLRLTGGLGPLQGLGLHGVLEFRLVPLAAGGTQVTMSYRAGGYAGGQDLSKLAPIVDQVQALQLDGLRTHLAGPRGSPLGPGAED